ncbi:unnamed protein product [Cladocopium goreaui]|uniref:Voltage-dependent L-type calcium channel subunit alpha-1F n=1 Tax=Cladocopium goreaui TaxID=2562237 RepID=A0A9P1FSE3_9DINO|nr:unnamed protein product [Cladocopium goreaui]
MFPIASIASSSMSASSAESSRGRGLRLSATWREMLEIWSDDGRLFTAVYLYKSRLSRLRLVPDFGGLLSHSGVVMEHALPLPGARSRFLRLDFGQDGLEIVASGHLPIIEDQINWSEDPFLEFLHADIAPGHGDPMALANLLEQLHGDYLRLRDLQSLKMQRAVARACLQEVFLILVLAALSFRTLDKGLEMFNHETTQGPQALPQEEEEHDASDEEDAKESRNLVAGNDLRRVQRSPSTKVSLLVCCFLGCVILTVLKGSGHGSIVGVTCGSLSFWLLTWATLPWVLGFGMIFRDILINEHLENEEDGHDYHCEEIRWNAVNTIRYPLLCSLAGVLAGLFGVGGGIIKGPLMLELGVEPQVAGATASTMILFTSASAAVSFQVFGLLKGDYGAFCFILGFSCTLLGQVAIQRWMQETKRPSVTVLSIGLVLAISTVLLVMEMIGHMARTEDLQKLVLPTSLCNIND